MEQHPEAEAIQAELQERFRQNYIGAVQELLAEANGRVAEARANQQLMEAQLNNAAQQIQELQALNAELNQRLSEATNGTTDDESGT